MVVLQESHRLAALQDLFDGGKMFQIDVVSAKLSTGQATPSDSHREALSLQLKYCR